MTLFWIISIALKATAAGVLVRRRMHAHYPILVAFLCYSTLASLFLVAVRGNKLVYGWSWLVSSVVTVVFLALVAIEAFRRVVEGYERFTWQLTMITGLATLAGFTVALFIDNGAPDRNYWSYTGMLATFEMYVIGGGFSALVAALFLLPRYRTVPIRPAAERNVLCVLVYIAGMFASSAFMQRLSTYPLAGWFAVGAATLASMLWIALMTPSTNEMPPAEVISDERLKKAERRLRDYRNFTALRP